MLTEVSGYFDLDGAIRIYSTREQVDAHNTTILDRYRTKEVRVFKIWSQDVLMNAMRNTDNVNVFNIVSCDINKVGGLQNELEIFN
ncbi:uncharacterized protein TNCT_712131 [Trichonephila clavata]|uniref:Uncharacterized protein n=1 Tax=Trichonephila clavata TaxID=2740835 RepID=A0A8X6LJ43_TRICU|nr:uncharacterized protein TNCT_712131 [Trichonephila clavata]